MGSVSAQLLSPTPPDASLTRVVCVTANPSNKHNTKQTNTQAKAEARAAEEKLKTEADAELAAVLSEKQAAEAAAAAAEEDAWRLRAHLAAAQVGVVRERGRECC